MAFIISDLGGKTIAPQEQSPVKAETELKPNPSSLPLDVFPVEWNQQEEDSLKEWYQTYKDKYRLGSDLNRSLEWIDLRSAYRDKAEPYPTPDGRYMWPDKYRRMTQPGVVAYKDAIERIARPGDKTPTPGEIAQNNPEIFESSKPTDFYTK